MIDFVALPIGTLVWVTSNGIEYLGTITRAAEANQYGGRIQYNHRAKVVQVMTENPRYGYQVGQEIPFISRTEIEEVLDGYKIYYS